MNKTLLVCNACGGVVGDSAAACPHCGSVLRKKLWTVPGILGFVVVLLGLILCLPVPWVGGCLMGLGLLLILAGRSVVPVKSSLRVTTSYDLHVHAPYLTAHNAAETTPEQRHLRQTILSLVLLGVLVVLMAVIFAVGMA